MPDTMSRTSVWLPNEMASPTTEAPAISGVMLTPKSSRATRTATMPMTIAMAMRRSGISVERREAVLAGASPSASAVGRTLACGPCRDRSRT